MTRPALAAKAREIAETETEPLRITVTNGPRVLGSSTARAGSPRLAKDTLQAAILAALIEADAAATERAAKVAESRAAKWTERIAEAVAKGYVPHYWRYFVTEADILAAAIRNQEPTDADT